MGPSLKKDNEFVNLLLPYVFTLEEMKEGSVTGRKGKLDTTPKKLNDKKQSFVEGNF